MDQLRHHGALGRLTLSELTGRIEAALDAKTLGDLDDLLGDLPRETPAGGVLQAVPPAPVAFRAWRSPTVVAKATQLLVLDVVCIGVWALAGGGSFWPAWVFLASVAVLARRTSRVAARAERARRRAERTRTPPPWLGR